MDQSSWDDTLLGVRPSPGPGRGAVSHQSSRDKRRKRSLPGSTVRREGRAISALRDLTTLMQGSLGNPDMWKRVCRSARLRVRSEQKAYGLKRDLDVPHTAPEALVPIGVRLIRDEDAASVLEPVGPMSLDEKWDRNQRLRLLESGVGSCYVAVTREDVPCFVQWLFSSADNDFLRDHFNGSFPRLDEGTVLLEGAYTPTAFRGQRIMSAAMSLIAERGRDAGSRYVVTFVSTDNVASLKGCRRAGFDVYLERLVRWRLLRSTVSFAPVTGESALNA